MTRGAEKSSARLEGVGEKSDPLRGKSDSRIDRLGTPASEAGAKGHPEATRLEDIVIYVAVGSDPRVVSGWLGPIGDETPIRQALDCRVQLPPLTGLIRGAQAEKCVRREVPEHFGRRSVEAGASNVEAVGSGEGAFGKRGENL